MEEATWTFSIIDETEAAIINIISTEEILFKLNTQFGEADEFGEDRTDYFEVYCRKFLGVVKEDFPENISYYINDNNEEEFTLMMQQFYKRLFSKYAVVIDMDGRHWLELLYTMYRLVVINPEQFIVDYLLYNHFYVDKYNFNEWVRKQRLEERTRIDLTGDAVNQITSQEEVLKQFEKDLVTLTYQDRFKYFLKYMKEILTNYDEFLSEDIFDKLNKFAPSQTYEFLNNCMQVFFELNIEIKELFVDKLIEKNMNTDFMFSFINEKIIDPFFKYLDQFVRKENQAFSGSVIEGIV